MVLFFQIVCVCVCVCVCLPCLVVCFVSCYLLFFVFSADSFSVFYPFLFSILTYRVQTASQKELEESFYDKLNVHLSGVKVLLADWGKHFLVVAMLVGVWRGKKGRRVAKQSRG